MTYKEQIKSPRWQKKRLVILSRDNFTCQKCNCDNKQLHVHHLAYLSGLKIYEYDNEMLITLCSNCHETIHEINKTLAIIAKEVILGNLDIYDILLINKTNHEKK